MIQFSTSSGTVYRIVNVSEVVSDSPDLRVRRVIDEGGSVKRVYERWLRLYNVPRVVVGEPVSMLLESLASEGADDYGFSGGTDYTVRTTSPVVKIF